MRTLILLAAFSLLLSSRDPGGERRLRVPLLPATTGYSTARQISTAERIADQMAARHGWAPEAITPEQRRRGLLRLYAIHWDDFTMYGELSLSDSHTVQLYFRDWRSLHEANEAYRRMDEFDREFHRAFPPQ